MHLKEFSIEDLREHVKVLQLLAPDNELYSNILKGFRDNNLSQELIKDISVNPCNYISYSYLVDLKDSLRNQPMYIKVEGTAIKIDF